jgi:predicted MFS family arabinose efflux permease
MSNSVTQILGYAVGGALLELSSARGALLIAAGLYLAAAVILRLGLADRPPRSPGGASISQTWTTNQQLWSSPARRYVYLALWVPNGLIVGCVALFVPYAARSAAVLFVAEGLGMLAGDTILGRFVPSHPRRWLIGPLRILLAAPYLVFVLRPPVALAVLIVIFASLGYSAALLLQARLIALTPPDIRGHALGLHNAGMLTMQAVGAILAGVLSDLSSPAAAITTLAVASLLTTLALTPRIRLDEPGPCSSLTSPRTTR